MGTYLPRPTVIIAVLACLAEDKAWAQADEIQVYDGSLSPPGIFNLTWHNNYTPSGIKTPAFPGAITSDRSFNGVTEWAYGVNNWWELGLYLPLYSIDKHKGAKIDGLKLRTLFAVPHAEARSFFYGLGIELSYNARHWDQNRITSEFRPIIGWHLGEVDMILNPIFDIAYDGFSNVEFAPSARLAYNFAPKWAIAAEHYASFGPVRDVLPVDEQSHQLYAVVDYAGAAIEIEGGIGFGLTDASDDLTLKLILSRDLN